MKNIVGVLLIAGTLQGCMAAPIIGAAAGMGGLVAIKKSGEDITVWSARVSRMNCSQMRTELVSLEKKRNILSALNPASTTGTKVSTLKSVLIQRGCRLPA